MVPISPMASSKFIALIHIVFLLHFLGTTLSQQGPSIAECGPYLLPLAPCGPFVQGTAPLPPLQCCLNLRQLYGQQASCLCLLLDGSTLSSFPINSTLALQLPTLCSMQIDTSICSASRETTPPPSLPPTAAPIPQVSPETKSNSTMAASPVVTVGPTQPRMPGFIGYGFQHSSGVNINVKHSLMVVSIVITYYHRLYARAQEGYV